MFPFIRLWRIPKHTFHLEVFLVLNHVDCPSRYFVFMLSAFKNYLGFYLFTVTGKPIGGWNKDSSASIFVLLPPVLIPIPVIEISKER